MSTVVASRVERGEREPRLELLLAENAIDGTASRRAQASEPGAAEREQRRWLVGLGMNFAVAAAFMAAVFATGMAWFLFPAVICALVAPLTLVYLSISSDTNSVRKPGRGWAGEPIGVRHPRRHARSSVQTHAAR